MRDVEEAAILCDGLENVDFVMSLFLPADVNPLVSDRYQMAAMLNKSSKPIIFVTNDFRGTVDAVEMAEVVAGEATALRERPTVACYINVTTGLRHNEDALKKLMYLADKNLPFVYAPVGQGGTTAPVTMAAGVVMVNAGVLAGLVLSQLVREGAPFIMPGWSGEYLDMRTMVGHYVFPNYSGMAHSIAHYYGLPQFGIGGCTDSKSIDQQAGIEAALTLMTETLGGSTFVHDLGYLESGLCGSLVQLAICDEMVRWLKHHFSPVEINRETLTLDLIDQMGPDGQYLETEHTLHHYRDRWYSDLFDRQPYHTWERGGSPSMADRAAERVNQVLSGHVVAPLPADVQDALDTILRRAEDRVLGNGGSP